ncbi:MAG: DEAD/DEAH box helicase, partial [Clostridia bacterium]|nr:DEAD/DEAH box helicase [Clostridia bacterium]
MQNPGREREDQLMAYYDQPLLRGIPIHLVIIFGIDRENHLLQVALKAGMKRMYVVQNIPEMINAYFEGKPLRMGKDFTLDGQTQSFQVQEEAFLRLLSEYTHLYSVTNVPQKRKYISIPLMAVTRILDVLGEHPFLIRSRNELTEVTSVVREKLPISFQLNLDRDGLHLYCRKEGMQAFSPDCAYVLVQRKLYRLYEQEREMLYPFLMDPESEYHLGFRNGERFLSEILPRLQACASVQVQEDINQLLVSEILTARAYLDREQDDLTCRLEFCYAERSIDPFSPKEDTAERLLLLRDSAAEHGILSLLSQYGFHVRPGYAHLQEDGDIYEFLTKGVEQLRTCAEVYLSDELVQMRPRRMHLSGSVRFNRGKNFLELTLQTGELPEEEIASFMQAVREKRRYVRLRDGSYLTLEDDGWEKISLLAQDALGETGNVLRFASYQAPALMSLLEGLPVEREEEVRRLYEKLTGVPEELPAPLQGMRTYQEEGFRWLYTLAELKMGGILADEMGLGKTVEVLALLRKVQEAEGGVSLCVVPTSLLYNWLAEAERFTPNLRVLICQGNAQQRLSQLSEYSRYDLILTSYAQMRRDIDTLEKIPFRICILDEAQHIKNASSQSFRAARRLSGESRFALTGTPVENHLGELWAVFDYVLPGFLGDAREFANRFQTSTEAQDRELAALRRRTAPFLLRRVKSDVLRDLPPKIEHDVLVDMTPEQYQAYAHTHNLLLRQIRHMDNQSERGRGMMRTLAAITRLRQLCCHPGLYLDQYEGSSGKLQACLELVAEAVEGGHFVLLFSQFTQMLDILRRHLRAMGISFLYMDGDTSARERVRLVNAFNACEADVFLISLRAGGFGLNLTNADVVIQYDPWWNPAVEDQASDRAHRIGQTRPVEVIRLVTRNSVEERVMALKEEKRDLIARAISGGETSIRELNREELRFIF